MSKILNTSSLHNNGATELVVGIRGNQFMLKKETDSDVVTLTDPITNKQLSLNALPSSGENSDSNSSQNVDLRGYATEQWVIDGYQPKGNYLTDDDIGDIVDTVKSEIPVATVAKAPVFVDSTAKMTDHGEVYVLLPEGKLWAYMAVDTVELGAELFEVGSIKADDGMDGGVSNSPNRVRTRHLPCTTETPMSIDCGSAAKWLAHFYRDETWLGKTSFVSTSNDNIVQLCSSPEDVTHVRIVLAYVSDANVTDIPDLLSNVTITQKVSSGMAWCNTGMAYNQPVDYEDRILAMETELEVLANGTF